MNLVPDTPVPNCGGGAEIRHLLVLWCLNDLRAMTGAWAIENIPKAPIFSLGKGEADSSILSSSTTNNLKTLHIFSCGAGVAIQFGTHFGTPGNSPAPALVLLSLT